MLLKMIMKKGNDEKIGRLFMLTGTGTLIGALCLSKIFELNESLTCFLTGFGMSLLLVAVYKFFNYNRKK